MAPSPSHLLICSALALHAVVAVNVIVNEKPEHSTASMVRRESMQVGLDTAGHVTSAKKMVHVQQGKGVGVHKNTPLANYQWGLLVEGEDDCVQIFKNSMRVEEELCQEFATAIKKPVTAQDHHPRCLATAEAADMKEGCEDAKCCSETPFELDNTQAPTVAAPQQCFFNATTNKVHFNKLGTTMVDLQKTNPGATLKGRKVCLHPQYLTAAEFIDGEVDAATTAAAAATPPTTCTSPAVPVEDNEECWKASADAGGGEVCRVEAFQWNKTHPGGEGETKYAVPDDLVPEKLDDGTDNPAFTALDTGYKALNPEQRTIARDRKGYLADKPKGCFVVANTDATLPNCWDFNPLDTGSAATGVPVCKNSVPAANVLPS